MELENLSYGKIDDLKKLEEALKILPEKEEWLSDNLNVRKVPLTINYYKKNQFGIENLTEIISQEVRIPCLNVEKFKVKKVGFNLDRISFEYKGNNYEFQNPRIINPKQLWEL